MNLMKIFLSLIISVVFFVNNTDAQKIFATRNGKVSFSAPSDEDVKAVNNEVTSRLAYNGQMTFSLLIKGFKFKYAEMQEHFNENYVESDKFPKALFKGTIENSKAISLTTDNVATVKVIGSLTMHGVTNPVNTTAIITIKNGVIAASSSFTITLADYKITIPDLVAEKINKKITITITIPAYQPLPAK